MSTYVVSFIGSNASGIGNIVPVSGVKKAGDRVINVIGVVNTSNTADISNSGVDYTSNFGAVAPSSGVLYQNSFDLSVIALIATMETVD